jgi:hypothetical protein
VRKLARKVALKYVEKREALGFPLLGACSGAGASPAEPRAGKPED